MFERKCGADLTLFFNGTEMSWCRTVFFNCLVSVVTTLKFCTDDGKKMYVIFIQLGMKSEFLLTLKENNSYKTYNLRIVGNVQMIYWMEGPVM